MDLTPLVTTFGIIALAELGDKTQLAVITLSCRYRPLSVFVGAMLAVIAIDGISILIGTALAGLLPLQLLKLISAAIFISFGIKNLIPNDEEKIDVKKSKPALLTSFSMLALLELGDKTQFSVIALAIKYNTPLFIFVGMAAAFALLMGLGVLIGYRLMKFMPKRYLKIITSAVFLIIGVLILAEALIK
ncbi:MAG: TMEM165/GDT1 family protein [Candidatus Hadarchaeum sp.]|uniref:TMEM165/GDT1 family protein n=1 Tax=Candidatus Hadarchaeum sp. TaxID=2883567 RepID=UPI00317C640C